MDSRTWRLRRTDGLGEVEPLLAAGLFWLAALARAGRRHALDLYQAIGDPRA